VKTKPRQRKSSALSTARWTSYAIAAGATAVAGTPTAEAEIHYSGLINFAFNDRLGGTETHSFPLSQGAGQLHRCSLRLRRRASRCLRPAKRAGASWVDEELAHLAVDAAWESLKLRAAVRSGPRGGSVEIRFSSAAELGRIIDQLRAERVSWAD
jgi:hypothetical protein